MAAGAWRNWAEAELVTEALFQDIQDSIVFIYSSDSAANTALTSKVEGTIYYNTTTNSLMAWSGSAWVAVGTTPGLNFIDGDTVSGAAAIDVDGCFTSTYRNYVLYFDGVGVDSTAQELRLKMQVTGQTPDATANSDWAGTISYYVGGAGHSAQADVDDEYFELIGNWIRDSHFSVVVDFLAPQVTDQTQIYSKVASHYLDTEQATQYTGGVKDETTAFDGFHLYCDGSQTMTGTWKLYGLVDS